MSLGESMVETWLVIRLVVMDTVKLTRALLRLVKRLAAKLRSAAARSAACRGEEVDHAHMA